MQNLDIIPLRGYGDLAFGASIDEVKNLLGSPDIYEEMDNLDDTGNCTIFCQYSKLDFNVYFEGVTKSVVACFDTENTESTLYGQPIFDLGPDEVVALMKSNGYVDMEREDEEGELRISYDDLMIDFFFVEDELVSVSWGVLVDERGDII